MRSNLSALLAVLLSLSAASAPAPAATPSLQGLGDLPGGGSWSVGRGVSGDGSTVVGLGNSASGWEAFRWTSAGGMVGLGRPAGHITGYALDVSGDGSVIVGYGQPASGVDEAFLWTSASGMERLWDVLLANGVDPAADGWTGLYAAGGISADGNAIAGYGIRNGNYEAFIAVIPVVPEPGTFSVLALGAGLFLPRRRPRRRAHRSCCETLEPRRLLSFEPAASFVVGPNPQAVATADLNEDGRLDLVTSNVTDNTISVRLGNGAGGFGAASHFDALYYFNPGAEGATLAIADFTGDGDLDVVTVQHYYGYGVVSLLPGNGDGTFDQAINMGGAASAAAAGHFNADTNSDFVVSWYDYDAFNAFVQTCLSDGHSGFTYPTPYKLADGLETDLAVGDINGDGKLDAVLVIAGSGNGWALIGKGDGTFLQPDPWYPWPGYEFPVGPGASDVALGDFTGDGKLDAVVTGVDLNVMPGRGDGTFGPPISHSASGNADTGVAVADFNADGKLDAVVTDAGTGTVSVMLGNGDGTLRYAGAFATGSSPSAVAVGDFNGDGRPDVAASNGGSNNISVLINDGNWATKVFVGLGGGGGGGDWSSGSNWSPPGVPASSDHVSIAGKSVNLGGSATVASLALSGGATLAVAANGGRVLRTANLTIAGTSKLNLNDNDMILDYAAGTASPLGAWNGSAYDGVTGLITRGYHHGAWDGSGLVTTRPDALNGITTLAVAEMSNVWGLSGSQTAMWQGHSVDATTIVIKYTYAGDANLDGQIDAGDYGVLDYFVQIEGASGYANGDFNLDGFIDAGDYGLIDSSIQSQGPQL